ncbi:hypothetical protein SDC9_131855 [bioreactor metagenome]|uniref:Uncharacterized protein n=1 Tax=bioreactor metagenome TaxID=1076179 RepID=A0A645D6E7_9ZZZZ
MKLVAAIQGAIGAKDLEVEIIDQCGHCARKCRDIRVGKGNLKRLGGIAQYHALLKNLSLSH